jgi:hypothetical protein
MNTSHHRWFDYAVLTCAFSLGVHNLDAPHFLSDNSYMQLFAANAGLRKPAGLFRRYRTNGGGLAETS